VPSTNNGTSSPIDTLGQPDDSNIRNVIAVMSGKGGVGKSSVSALLAKELRQKGFQVGLLDADITGPSIPKLFGLKSNPSGIGEKLLPQTTKTGIKVMSLNLLLKNEEDPVVWRSPLIVSAVRQFWTDVIWGDIDYMIVDLPPGTGDVPLTVFQSLAVNGVVIVSTPRELSILIVKKAVNMANLMEVPILGVVENMAYVTCPKCGEQIDLSGGHNSQDTASSLGIKLLASLPLDPNLSSLGDEGRIEDYISEPMTVVSTNILERLK
jgi:Mrp family chromosome partitioning ATPase